MLCHMSKKRMKRVKAKAKTMTPTSIMRVPSPTVLRVTASGTAITAKTKLLYV